MASRFRESLKDRNVKFQKSFLQKQGIAVREGAVLDPSSPDFDYGEYQKSQAIKYFTGTTPAIASGRYAQSKQAAKSLRQYTSILQQQKKFSPTAESIAEARAGGADPRTIASFVAEGDRLTKEYRTILEKSRGAGIVGSFNSMRAAAIRERGYDVYTGDYFGGKKVEPGRANLSALGTDITEKAKSEGVVQQQLGEIRRKRQTAVESQQQSLSRKRGKVSLLSGQSGGAGFFSGYFN